MAIFDALDRVVSNTVDRINAIDFIFFPRKSTPNGRDIKDTTRRAIQSKGIFDYISATYGVQLGVRRSYREANDLRAIQSGRVAELSVDRRIFGSDSSQEPRQGDIIKFPGKPDYPAFQIISVQRDGLARLVIELVHVGSQA